MAQMENFSSSLDLPVSGMPIRLVNQVSANPESHHVSVSKEQMGVLDPIPDNRGHTNFSGGSMVATAILTSDKLVRENGVTNDLVGGNTSLPLKRKAEAGSMSRNSTSQQSHLPAKRPANLGADVSSVSALQKKTGQVGPGSPGVQAKRTMRNETISGRAGLQRGQHSKRQTSQAESASKGRPESSEAVRSKMRESLAAALDLAFQKPDNVAKNEKEETHAPVTHQIPPVGSQASESNSNTGGHVTGSVSVDAVPSNESAVVSKTEDSQVLPVDRPPNESSKNGGQSFQEFQYSLLDEDVSFGDGFFEKDDLLQGNGLSWAFDFDMQMRDVKEAQNVEKPQHEKEEVDEHREDGGEKLTPENLAFQIECELFKQYGGVNKKYKEKGRSLLFNLKDRNNPELRERVISGEISPERLCSMSAEELASKELSEWRMAKAEEMAQMVVLPNTEGDVRRLVKKTHKGEYQVEFEHDDGIVADVSGGTSMLMQSVPRKDIDTHSPSESDQKDKENVGGQENSPDNHDFSDSLIIPADGTDLMQGMMVDELKDAKFLPPIVSLDEFMESLNSEPPFENLSDDAGQKSPILHEPKPKSALKTSWASNRASDSQKDASSKKSDDVRKHEIDTHVKSSWSPAKHKVLPSIAPKVDYIWEGVLQLSISSSVTVGGLFQSGEKTSTKEWPTSLEIKGRVRLDAFEKFLQQLPMSRTRAVMVLQFVLKDKTSEKEFAEAADSFASDERLGYAEPAPGVELYLCPRIAKISEMINKYTTKGSKPEKDNPIENGLIGVVVWRRAHISNVTSPNASSHHKHASKKQPLSPHHRAQDNTNVNTPPGNPPPVVGKSKPAPEPEEDDDIPPGFGPAAAARAKDDDDLPEFNFSGHATRSPLPMQKLHHGATATQTPVDQVRELIQKYGQSGNSTTSRSWVDERGLGIEPWNDDEDDDIPEWRPEAPPQLHRPAYPAVHGHRPMGHSLPTTGPVAPVVAQSSPGGLPQPPPGGRWGHPRGAPHGARWRPY